MSNAIATTGTTRDPFERLAQEESGGAILKFAKGE
jgi:hypothetical protein